MGNSAACVRSSIFFTIALVAVNFTNQSFGAKGVDDHWQALNYKFERVAKKLATTSCYQDEKSFSACVHAANAILEYSGKTLRLVPEAYRSAHNEYAAAVQSFGPAGVVEAPASKATNFAQLVRETREIKKDLATEWHTVFTGTEKVDFDGLTKWARGEEFFSKNESKIVGAVTNAFYEILHDPHTTVIPTPHYKEMFQAEEAVVGVGVGLQILERGGKKLPIIMNILEDSPASKAGLLPNDVLTAIDGVQVEGLTIDEITKRVRGKAGSTVILDYTREEKAMSVSIVREAIQLKNVRSKMVGKNSDIGYVRLSNFMEMDEEGKALPCKHVREAITSVENKGAKSLIFDLRNNGGGLLTEAECISNLFLDLKGGEPIASTKGLVPEVPGSVLPSGLPEKIHTKLPMALLINSNSASASEIVAGALQDYERAFLIGERSYGKGSVQSFRKLGLRGELMLKETIARFYRPSGLTNQIVSVLPDIERFRVPNPTEDDKTAMREEDSYAALPPIGPTWKPTRPDKVAKVEDCMKRTGIADAEFEAHKKDALGADYQLYAAIDAVNCVNDEKLWSITDKRPTYSWPDWIVKEKAIDFLKNIQQNFQSNAESRIY